MSTIENAENLVQNQEAPSGPALKRSKSNIEAATPLERITELVEAWKAGKFNGDDVDANIDAFFTDDFVHDVETSAGHTGAAPFKKYGKAATKEWFIFAAQWDLKGLDISFVQSPKSPDEVWQRFESTEAVWKPTGKSVPMTMIFISTWTKGKCSKMSAIYDDPARAAAVQTDDAPIPPAATLPSFEPHPDPKSCWDILFPLWAMGEFAKPETKQAALDKYVAADVVQDATSSVLPEILKPYVGHAGVDTWCNDVIGATWELSNIDVAAVAGLKPGCVLQRFTCDVKHNKTGKEAKGVDMYMEMAYNTDGKFVWAKHYFANPQLLASIY